MERKTDEGMEMYKYKADTQERERERERRERKVLHNQWNSSAYAK